MSNSNAKSSFSKEDLVKYTKPIVKALSTAIPIVITYCQKAWNYYKSLPEDVLQLIIGLIFCFFGGIFPVLFAAIEAAKHGGLSSATAACGDLGDEALKIIEANKKDDDLDENGDGKKDVDQIDTKELILRKTKLVLTKMNPEKINKALASIYTVWLSVVAVLSLGFAQTIAMSVSISKFLQKPVQHYLTPRIKSFVPDEYDKWIPVIMGWITKSISISIAWTLNTIITAVTSALTGALIASRALLKIAVRRDVTLDGIIPKDDKETYIDETLSYALAVIGLWFQFKTQFSVPFPLNLFLWPLNIAEYFIRWSITEAN